MNKAIDDFQKWLNNEKLVSLDSHNNNILVARNGYWVSAVAVYNEEVAEKTPNSLLFQVGDTIWYAWKGEKSPNGYFEQQRISEIRIQQNKISYRTNQGRIFANEDFGKLFFRSYEEAKKVLSMEKNETAEIER